MAAVIAGTTVFGGLPAMAEETGKVLRITQSSGGVIDPGTSVDCASCIACVNMYDFSCISGYGKQPNRRSG